MQKLFLTIAALLIPVLIHGQAFQKKFETAYAKNDTTAMRHALSKWEKATPNDAELFPALFNYYFVLASQNVLVLSPNTKPERKSDSLGNPAGSISSATHYNMAYIQKGIEAIDRGISRYPDRLDMHFGKIFVLGETQNWEQFTQSIITAIERSAVNKNKWLWTNNEPSKEDEESFLEALQDYQLKIYNKEDNSLLPYMRRIGEAVLKVYPHDVRSLNNIAISCLIEKKYDEALTYLLRAEKLNPNDEIVVNNIAETYRRLNKKEEAEIYRKKAEMLKQTKEQK